MIKNVHLGFFINEYGKDPIWTDLAQFKDVDELDYFMDYFYNNNEKIKKLFSQDISDYSIDNIGQFKKVDEIIKGNFRGRIAAYYYHFNKMEFLELPKANYKPIRDYRRIHNCDKSINYLSSVFIKAVEKINKKYEKSKYGPPKGEFIHYVAEKLYQASYEMSESEIYDLATYYNKLSDKNRKRCLDSIKTNVKSYYQKKAEKELEKQYEEDIKLSKELMKIDKDEIIYDIDTPAKLQYDIEKVKETNDYDNLYLNHDLDEIDKYTNVNRKGR